MTQSESPKEISPQQSHPLFEGCPICNGTGMLEREGTYYDSCECVKIKTRKRYFGERFHNIDLASIVPRSEKQKKLKELLLAKPATSIFLSGEIRKGKTHFLASMFVYWHKRSGAVKYFDDASLRDELRNADLNGYPDFARDIVRDHRHIFLDDIGKAGMSEAYRKGLYTFVNEIYKHHRHIFITSNDPISILGREENWGPYVTRRIEDTCEIVEF